MAQRAGRIVNLASEAGKGNEKRIVVYGATKGGVISLTRGLAIELGRFGITVNAVCPGVTRTPMTSYITDEMEREWARYLSARPARPARGHRADDRVPRVVAGVVDHRAGDQRERRLRAVVARRRPRRRDRRDRSRLRYCTASRSSARMNRLGDVPTPSAPARSAIVRATLSTRV